MSIMEPTSTSSAAGLLAWKLIGGLAGIGAIGAGLATIVVMCVLRPRTQSEWVVGIISTVMGSVCGGAFVVQHYDLQHWAYNPFGMVAMIGLVFACGLPAWAIVRWTFNYIDKNQSRDIAEIVSELREQAKGQ